MMRMAGRHKGEERRRDKKGKEEKIEEKDAMIKDKDMRKGRMRRRR